VLFLPEGVLVLLKVIYNLPPESTITNLKVALPSSAQADLSSATG
jgi:hypothetical protein